MKRVREWWVRGWRSRRRGRGKGLRRRGGEEIILLIAGVTQLVECNLAKVDVEGSNPFARSNEVRAARIHYAGGENWMARGVVYGAQSLRLIQTQSYLGLNE